MTKSLEMTGRNEEDAIAAALKELGLMRDDVTVEVLERGKSGFLGIGAQPARVLVTYEAPDEAEPAVEETPVPAKPVSEKKAEKPAAEKKTSPAEKPVSAKKPVSDDAKVARLDEFLKGLFERMGVEADAVIEYDEAENTISVELTGSKVGALIGRRGETLDAIQHLSNYVINNGETERTRINMDAENYRAKRAETLENVAKKTAAKVVKYRRNITLEPMNAYERHVIHTALQDFGGVTTFSTGTEPNRRVVIAYAYDRSAQRSDRGHSSGRPRRDPRPAPVVPAAEPEPQPARDTTTREWH